MVSATSRSQPSAELIEVPPGCFLDDLLDLFRWQLLSSVKGIKSVGLLLNVGSVQVSISRQMVDQNNSQLGVNEATTMSTFNNAQHQFPNSVQQVCRIFGSRIAPFTINT